MMEGNTESKQESKSETPVEKEVDLGYLGDLQLEDNPEKPKSGPRHSMRVVSIPALYFEDLDTGETTGPMPMETFLGHLEKDPDPKSKVIRDMIMTNYGHLLVSIPVEKTTKCPGADIMKSIGTLPQNLKLYDDRFPLIMKFKIFDIITYVDATDPKHPLFETCLKTKEKTRVLAQYTSQKHARSGHAHFCKQAEMYRLNTERYEDWVLPN